MDESKINELLKESQADFENALNMPIKVIRSRENIHYSQLFEAMSEHVPAFGHLYIELERGCKFFISRRTNANVDDVWHDFIEKKLPRVIIGYDFDNVNNRSFIAYLKVSLARFITGYNPNRQGNPNKDISLDEIIADGGQIPNPESELTMRERIDSMELLDIFIPALDNFRSRDDKKLVYHCVRFLKEVCKYDDYTLLENWRGQTLKIVTSLIEKSYSKALGTKTRYMETINRKIDKDGRAEKLFLENIDIDSARGKQKIREWVKDIDDSFIRHKEEIINHINN